MQGNIVTCDTLIIGGGPGGYSLAASESAKGRKVVLIEKNHLGGTCLNRGCIPTKCLCATASALAAARSGAALGVGGTAGATLDIDAAREHKNKTVEGLRADIASLLSDCTVVNDVARFDENGRIVAGDTVYEATRTVIATGSRPAVLPIPGAELCVDSDAMLGLDSVPESLCVIGGGVIGLELASAYADFGSQVSVIEFLPEILPAFDADIARRLRSMLQRRGIRITTGAAAQSVIEEPDGKRRVTYTSRGKEQSVVADVVLMATGRTPVVPEGADHAGIELDRRGRIVTDPVTFATTRPGVFAIGDCAGTLPMLAHVAEAQATILATTDFTGTPSVDAENNALPDLGHIPSVIYSRPEAFSTGLTESSAREAGREVIVRKLPVAANGYARAIGHADGLLKTITDATTGRILGIHYAGPAADTLIGEAHLAVTLGLTSAQIHRTIHPHPTLTELLPPTL